MVNRTKKTIKTVRELPDDCLPMCCTCNAYVKHKNHDDQGSCRANPPQLVVINDELDAKFPVVFHDEWCRRWERRTH